MDETLIIVMPAYNEEEALVGVLDGWYPLLALGGPDSRLVVVDDGSSDATPVVLESYRREHPKLVVERKPNGGHGSAVYRGYKFALDYSRSLNRAWVFQTDSDGQTSPCEFQAFWGMRDSYDAVMGARTKRQDGFSRVVVMRALRLAISLTMRIKPDDANVPYRLMRRDALEECLSVVPKEHYLTNVLLSAALYRAGKQIAVIPISFSKRARGTNSINLRKIACIGMRSIREFREFGRCLDEVFGK